MNKFLSKFTMKILVMLLLTLITTIGLSYIPKVYKYDPVTGLWQRVNRDVSEVVILPSAQNDSSNISASIGINGVIIVEPATDTLKQMSESSILKGQWYYYIEYTIKNNTQNSYYGIIAGQNQNIGITTVWNDDDYIYVKFELLYGWLANESHLNISYQKPSGNQNPGQFTYKTTHDPMVTTYEYKVGYHNAKDVECVPGYKIYILLHLSVKKNNQQQTAWAGGEPPCGMCVEVSNTKMLWYIRKPGKYVTNAFEVKITSTHPVVITFSNFDDLQPQGGIGFESIKTSYAISDDLVNNLNWISAPLLNNYSVTLDSGSSSLNFYQLVDLKTQSSGIYKNIGTITFTLQNTKAYVDKK
ncbi:MAG TPA: hypothetical protein VIL29_09140 [Pseudothermotoga sp.]